MMPGPGQVKLFLHEIRVMCPVNILDYLESEGLEDTTGCHAPQTGFDFFHFLVYSLVCCDWVGIFTRSMAKKSDLGVVFQYIV